MNPTYMTSMSTLDGCWHVRHVAVRDARGNIVPEGDAVRVSDEHLDFWGALFVDNNLYAEGITFETFVQVPYQILNAIAQRRANHYADTEAFQPLLPAQARLQRKLDLQAPLGRVAQLEAELDKQPGIVNRNGTWIERLRHHAWPRNSDRRVS